MIEFLADNWQWILLAFYVLEKIVKITPSPYDDLLVDWLLAGLKKLVAKAPSSDSYPHS